MPLHTGRRRGVLALTALAPLALLALAGCSTATEQSPRPSSSSASAGAGSSYATRYDWELALARCTREKGGNVADPVAPDGVTDQSDPANEEAIKACFPVVGDPPAPSDSEVEAAREYTRKLVECLHEGGYDVKGDPESKDFAFADDIPPKLLDTCNKKVDG